MRKRNYKAAAINIWQAAGRTGLGLLLWPFRRIYNRTVAFIVRRYNAFLKYQAFEDAADAAVRDWAPDVIHAHDLYTLPAGDGLAGRIGAKLVYDSHELETHRQPPPPQKVKEFIARLERRHIAQTSAVITVSDAIADHLAELYSIERPYVVRNAPRAPTASTEDTSNIRDDLGLAAGDTLLVYVGLVTLNRGLDIALRAIASVPGVTLAAVGPQRRESVDQLTTLAGDLGVVERFRILDPVEPDHVVDYVRSANAGIIPILPITLSYEYAMPNKLFEMAFAGLPIVASDLTEIGAFMRENDLGTTYAPHDVDACAAAIRSVLNEPARWWRSPDEIDAMRRAHDWTAQCEILSRCYNKLGVVDRQEIG